MTPPDDREQSRFLEPASAANDFFEMSLDNVCVAGFDGTFKRVNPSWERTLGWTPEEMMARPILDFVHPDDREGVLAGRRRLVAGEAMGPLINRYACKDGTYRWFEWRSVADPDRQLVYAVARDITEQKLAEARLREAQAHQEQLQRQLMFAERMASVGTLAAGVAHEINNPLAFVTSNVTLLIEELERLEDVIGAQELAAMTDMAKQASLGAERIHKIVSGLRSFSRAQDEQRAVLDVVPLLETSVDMTRNEIRHRAVLVCDFSPIPPVMADEARLGQVFINLLVNAAQSLPDGDSEANEIRVVTRTDADGRAVIEIHDSGCGIAAPQLERVFDPFFTTKPVGLGTGLGLSICHTIVTALDGVIEIESEEAVGTVVRVRLPAALVAPTVPVVASKAQPATTTTRARILVVDDEPLIGVVLGRILRDHDVTSVTNAQKAIAALESGEFFDVIFSDLMMPMMSGMEFYEVLQTRFPAVVPNVVFISGGAFTPTARTFLDSVPNERLDKPFTPAGVRDVVARFTAARGSTAGR